MKETVAAGEGGTLDAISVVQLRTLLAENAGRDLLPQIAAADRAK